MSAGRILVVDDEPQIRRIMRTTLTGAGYEVDDAKNGEEALAKRPGLLVTVPVEGGHDGHALHGLEAKRVHIGVDRVHRADGDAFLRQSEFARLLHTVDDVRAAAGERDDLCGGR